MSIYFTTGLIDMYGFETGTIGASIDSEFKSLALKRKGVGDANLSEITCLLDEVVVIRASSACIINCYLVVKNGNYITYKLMCIPAGDFNTLNVSAPNLPHDINAANGLKIEYFIFGSPNPDNSEYGLNIFDSQGEVVFSSNNKYLSPVSSTYVKPDGQSVCYPEDIGSREKLGVLLSMNSVFFAPPAQANNGIRVAQTVMAFEPFKGDVRRIGLYITPAIIEGSRPVAGLSGNVTSIIVNLLGL